MQFNLHFIRLLGILIVFVSHCDLVLSTTAPITSSFTSTAQTIYVSNETQLYKAIKKANKSHKATDIVLADGLYNLKQRLQLTGSHISLRSLSGDPKSVILSGQGMKKTNTTEVLIDVSGSHISISAITLENSANHLIQIRSEKNADHFLLSHCVLRDAYEQLLKVSSSPSSDSFADNGTIKGCLFEYTAGIGPQFYIGGIDAHRSRNWTISGNTFKNIASPSVSVAEHAIHFWKQSAQITVTHNTIQDCDRGIGFGLGESQKNQTDGGLITNNVIRNTNLSHPFADAGIILEGSPNVQIMNNRIFIKGNYPNAIEYRFASTNNIQIKDNVTNKSIVSRDGGQAALSGNLQANLFEQVKHKLEYFIHRL